MIFHAEFVCPLHITAVKIPVIARVIHHMIIPSCVHKCTSAGPVIVTFASALSAGFNASGKDIPQRLDESSGVQQPGIGTGMYYIQSTPYMHWKYPVLVH